MKKKLLNAALLLTAIAAIVVSCNPATKQVPPVFTIEDTTVSVDVLGGDFTINYTVENPVKGAEVKAASSEKWLSIQSCTDGAVAFTVSTNESAESRSATVTVEYVYGDKSLTATVEVVQAADIYDWKTKLNYTEVYYFSTLVEPEYESYQLFMYSNWTSAGKPGPGCMVYATIIHSTVPCEDDNVILPDGTYNLGDGPNALFADYTVTQKLSDDGSVYDFDRKVTAATLTVKNENGVTNITGEFTDETGEKHWFKYSGQPKIFDKRYESTLKEDVNVDFTGSTLTAYYWGNLESSGASDWIIDVSSDKQGLQIDIFGDPSADFAGGLPAGNYHPWNEAEGYVAGIFDTGYNMMGYLGGSWFYTTDNEGNPVDPKAPLMDGSVKIEKNGEKYTITVDATDDRGNSIKGTWTGVPVLEDLTAEEQACTRPDRIRTQPFALPAMSGAQYIPTR